MYRTQLLSRQLPMNISAAYRIPMSALEPALQNQAIAVRLVPLIANHYMFGTCVCVCVCVCVMYIFPGIPLEFVNYIVSLLALCIVWPSVYWRVCKSFTAVFTSHLCIFAVHATFAYISMSLLLRVHMIGARVFVPHNVAFLLRHSYCIIGMYLCAHTHTHTHTHTL
jgi:hypothetical protein